MHQRHCHFQRAEIKLDTFMQLQKFTAKYHVPQEAIHHSELDIIITTITELNAS